MPTGDSTEDDDPRESFSSELFFSMSPLGELIPVWDVLIGLGPSFLPLLCVAVLQSLASEVILIWSPPKI
jgi:hypothetical protein